MKDEKLQDRLISVAKKDYAFDELERVGGAEASIEVATSILLVAGFGRGRKLEARGHCGRKLLLRRHLSEHVEGVANF